MRICECFRGVLGHSKERKRLPWSRDDSELLQMLVDSFFEDQYSCLNCSQKPTIFTYNDSFELQILCFCCLIEQPGSLEIILVHRGQWSRWFINRIRLVVDKFGRDAVEMMIILK